MHADGRRIVPAHLHHFFCSDNSVARVPPCLGGSRGFDFPSERQNPQSKLTRWKRLFEKQEGEARHLGTAPAIDRYWKVGRVVKAGCLESSSPARGTRVRIYALSAILRSRRLRLRNTAHLQSTADTYCIFDKKGWMGDLKPQQQTRRPMSDEFDDQAFEQEKADAPELYQRIIAVHEARFGLPLDRMQKDQRLFSKRSFRVAYRAYSVLAEIDAGPFLDRLSAGTA